MYRSIFIVFLLLVCSLSMAGVKVTLDAPSSYSGSSFEITAEFSFDMSVNDICYMDISFPKGVESVEVLEQNDWYKSIIFEEGDQICLKSGIQYPAKYPLVSSYIEYHTGDQNLKLKLKITPKDNSDVEIYYRGTWGEETVYEVYPSASVYFDQQGWFVNMVKVVLEPDLVVSSVYVNNPDNTKIADKVKITAEITDKNKTNVGEVKLHYFVNGVYLDDDVSDPLSSEDPTDKEYAYFNASKSGVNTIKVIVDPDDDISESNDKNNEAIYTFMVNTDNIKPSITFIEIPKEKNVFNDVHFSWLGSDSDGSIKTYEYELDGISTTDNVTDFSREGLSDGWHTFKVRCYDDQDLVSDWISFEFFIVVNMDVMVIYDGESELDILEYINLSNHNYESIQLYDINNSSIDLSSIGTFITSLDSYKKITNTQVKEKPVVFISKEKDFDLNDDISIKYTTNSLKFEYKDMSAPIAGYIDYFGKIFYEEMGAQVTGMAVPFDIHNTIYGVSKEFSEEGMFWGGVSIIGEVSGAICGVTIRPCLTTGYACVATVPACLIKAVTMVSSSLNKAGFFDNIQSKNGDYYHNLKTSRLYYPLDQTINCDVYYEYNEKLGYYGLKTDAPNLCNYSNINLVSNNGYFSLKPEGLSNSGKIYSTLDGVESFNEETSFIVSSDSKIQLDIIDNSFEFYSSSSTTPDSKIVFEPSETFTEDMTLTEELFYPNNQVSEDTSVEEDFVINTSGAITRYEDISIESSAKRLSNINNEISFKTDVSMVVNNPGILQIAINGEDGIKALEFRLIEGSQSLTETFDIAFIDLKANKLNYNVYVQFRPNSTEGPLETTEISDVINYIYDYNVDIITSIQSFEHNDNVENIMLYPNPSSDVLHCEYFVKDNCSLTISIYSVEGRLVKTLTEKYISSGKSTFSWYIPSNLNRGTYIIQFRTNSKVTCKKVIVI